MRDLATPGFLAAALLGPLFWAILFGATNPALHPSWPFERPGEFALLAIAYPVLEEIVFRGWLQESLRARPWGSRILVRLTCANILTSLAFSLAHLLRHEAPWAAAMFFPSVLFGHFKDRTGRLLAPIALHVFYNAGYFWLFAG